MTTVVYIVSGTRGHLLSIYISVCVTIYIHIYLNIYQSRYLYICLSIYPCRLKHHRTLHRIRYQRTLTIYLFIYFLSVCHHLAPHYLSFYHQSIHYCKGEMGCKGVTSQGQEMALRRYFRPDAALL